MLTRDPQYLLENPVEIGYVLKELLRGADRICTSRGGEILPVYLTQVDVRRRTVNFLPYGGERERQLLVSASELLFEGAAYGTPVEFSLGPLAMVEEMTDEGDERQVIQSPFPTQLYRMQRRQFFRAPVAPPNTRRAVWQNREGAMVVFRIQDVSLSGIGLRIEANTDGLPPEGALMYPVQLDFEEHGGIEAWLQVVAKHNTTEFDTRRGHIEYTHLGCIFAEPDAQREAFLQKLVFALEKNVRR